MRSARAVNFWLALFFVHLLLRFAVFYTPILDIDESQFSGFAQTLLAGQKPYLASLDTKPLGIYLFYSFGFWLFGMYNMIGIHVLTVVIQFLVAVACYQIVVLITSNPKRGYLASLFYVIFSCAFLPKFLATSINSIMMVFLVASFYQTIKSTRQSWTPYLDISAGLWAGVAFIFKYTAGSQLIFFTLFILCLYLQKKISLGLATLRLTLFGTFFLLPFLVHAVILIKWGVWDDFAYWSFTGSQNYISGGAKTINPFLSVLLRFMPWLFIIWPLWFFSAKNKLKNSNTALLLWLLASLIPVLIGWRFYSHYFLHVLPAFCILGAMTWPFVSIRNNSFVGYKKILCIYLSIISIVFWSLRFDHKKYLEWIPDDQIYEQIDVGNALKEMANPHDKLFVWGFATAIYFQSQLQPASRFLWTDWQTGRMPGPDYARTQNGAVTLKNQDKNRAWDDLMSDLYQNKPQWIADTSESGIHYYQNHAMLSYPYMADFIKKYYIKVATINGVHIYSKQKDGI